MVALEEALAKERRERAAMEEALTEAYSTALRQVVEQQQADEEAAALAKAAVKPRGHHGVFHHR